MSLRWYSGGWKDVKAVRTHNGSSWINRRVKTYSGGSWVTRNEEVYSFYATDTFTVASTTGNKDTYFGNYAVHSRYSTSSPYHIGYIMFNYTDIQNKLNSKFIYKVELFLKRVNSSHGSSANAYVNVYAHPFKDEAHAVGYSWSSQVGYLGYRQADKYALTRGESGWATLDNTIGEVLRDGSKRGLAVYDPNHATGDYAYIEDYADTYKPHLKITCY